MASLWALERQTVSVPAILASRALQGLDARAGWGSCSSKGVITFNLHLVKAPPECIDYVVAHEVCHLREHNHGKAFYALQEKLYPRWREAKARLKAEGHIYLHL